MPGAFACRRSRCRCRRTKSPQRAAQVAVRAMDRGGFQEACERRGVAAAAAGHRRGRQLRRRVAGRPARRRAARAARRHQGAVRRLRARRRQARDPHFRDRRRAGRAFGIFAQQSGGRGLSERASARLGDPAPGAGARSRGLWRHRDAARHRGLSGRRAGGARRRAHPGHRAGRSYRNRRVRAGAASAGQDRVGGCAPAGAPPRRYRDRDPWLARLSTAARAGAAGRVRKSGGGQSPTRSAFSAGAAPRARPRWRSSLPA